MMNSPLVSRMNTLLCTNFCAVQKEVVRATNALEAVEALAHVWMREAERLDQLVDQARRDPFEASTATDVSAAVRAAMTQVLNVLLYHGHEKILENLARQGERP